MHKTPIDIILLVISFSLFSLVSVGENMVDTVGGSTSNILFLI